MTKYARRCTAHTTWAGATFFAAFVNRIADRVLLANISWNDLREHGFC